MWLSSKMSFKKHISNDQQRCALLYLLITTANSYFIQNMEIKVNTNCQKNKNKKCKISKNKNGDNYEYFLA